jgi:DivIVA domain-containing protein
MYDRAVSPAHATGPAGPAHGLFANEVTGDDVRRLQFNEASRGYHPADVDALLETVARAIDDGDSIEPLLRGAAFRRAMHGYRQDDVDRVLVRLTSSTCRPSGRPTPATVALRAP